MEYTIRKDQNTNNETLVLNGIDVSCAYQNSHLIPSQMGQIQLMRLPCSLNCAHAELSEDKKTYTITCGAVVKKFDIVTSNEDKKPTLSIV